MIEPYLDNFNSNMVRLKGTRATGTLATGTHFNSNMVRLKGFETAKRVFWHSVFQFQYGSIKRNMDEETTLTHLNFNSNMVRLKEPKRKGFANGYAVFQFQYGSIKR